MKHPRPSNACGPEPAHPLERYRALLGSEWAAFAHAVPAPLAPCVQVNTARIDTDALATLLADDRTAVEAIGWCDGALRLPGTKSPGLTRAHRLGLYRVQEESAMVPVRLLEPRPGERVLDLCAAPGNKTAQLALALGNRGTVVANDRDPGRIPAVQDVVRRFGLVNITTTCRDGTKWPLEDGPFDRVLVDAPCSSEGTVHKGHFRVSGADFRRRVAGVQRALLRRAVALCRPGGRVVYATCTFAPEENEAVVSAVLAEQGSDLRVVPTPMPGLAAAPGLPRWDGADFHPDLRHALRLWPHRTRTGGFFAVALERTGGIASGTGGRAVDFDADPELSALVERHALPADVLDGVGLTGRGRYLRGVARDHRAPAHVKRVATGLPFARRNTSYRKLTTVAAMAFGRDAGRNVVDVDAAGLDAYHSRREMSVDEAALVDCGGGGPILVRFRGLVAGVGLLRRRPEGVFVESLYPKVWHA